ncbi:MAG: transposase family protein [Candidatus Paracaedibacter sp.]
MYKYGDTLEPVLATVMAISKRKHLSKEEIECFIIDATEQPIERPKKGQKPYYSGKKKRQTIKTELRINPKGRIVHVSKPKPGSVHDFELHKTEPPILKDTRAFVDSGYQGLDKLHNETELRYKTTKTKPLDAQEKEYNTALSCICVKVENIIGDLKTFRILSYRYRTKCKRYNVKFNIIAGIVNLKNGFESV